MVQLDARDDFCGMMLPVRGLCERGHDDLAAFKLSEVRDSRDQASYGLLDSQAVETYAHGRAGGRRLPDDEMTSR